MVSLQVVYPFFDYGFIDDVPATPAFQVVNHYDENSIMDLLQKHHRKMAFIAKTARLDVYLSEPSLRCTLLVPPESTLSDNMLISLDIDSARRFLKYHLLIGIFPKDVILTSVYQKIQTSIKGEMIIARISHDSECVLNDISVITRWNIGATNGYIHLISSPLLL